MEEEETPAILSVEKVEELFNFLAYGTLPEGVSLCHKPVKMGPKRAFSIIWFLQEVTGALESKFERCERCDSIYDREREGMSLEKGRPNFICGNCITDRDERRYQREIGT